MICSECLYDNHAGAATCFNCGKPPWIVMRNSVVGGRYGVLGVLGNGGMGVVYKAHDRTLDEPVALKVLRPEVVPQEVALRFHSEIKLARRVRHPNVCAIHEYGEDGSLRYIAMEFVAGRNLRELLANGGPLAPDDACDVALQILYGLGAVHDLGIIHRDLKTANIMRDEQGVIRLMDFGLATLRRSDDSRATMTLSLSGTPEYMSPEQIRGERGDFQSDIYSLGVILFEILTGEVPFRGANVLATMQMQLSQPPPLDGTRPALLPARLVPVLRKALAKEPSERYATARGMATALRLVRETIAEPALAEMTRPSETAPAPAAAQQRPDPDRSSSAEGLWALVTRLSSGDVPERCVAALTLGRMGPGAKDAVPALVEALNDPHPHVAEAAGAALKKIAGTPPPAPEPPSVTLPESVEPAPVIDLIDMLRHPDVTLRLIAAEALGETRSEGRQAVPILVEVFEDKDEAVSREAARALGKLGALAAIPSLAAALSDAPGLVRVSAAEALGKIGPRANVAIPALIAALKHADDGISGAAASALGTMGLWAAPALIEAVSDHDGRLSFRAAAVLTKIVTAAAA